MNRPRQINPVWVELVEEEARAFRILTQDAVVLLSQATPNKILTEEASKRWCLTFGKWFAEAKEQLNKRPGHL
jgi:hypothetical protein